MPASTDPTTGSTTARDGDVTTDPVDAPLSSVPVGHQGARVDISEGRAWCLNGFAALFLGLVIVVGSVAVFVRSLLPLGVDCIVTNRPDRVREWVEENP